MGGWGSGRRGGRPVKEEAKIIDLARMLRERWISEGRSGQGNIHWWRGDEPTGSISYKYDLENIDNAHLTLVYKHRHYGGDWIDERQFVRLEYAVPHFGGRRWWMRCPVNGDRVAKLYLPAGGDIFASRRAWRLGYRLQRVTERDKCFERLNALQRKLGCPEGWESPIRRPKGMWHSTFAKHEERYWELDEECGVHMMAAIGLLRGSLK